MSYEPHRAYKLIEGNVPVIITVPHASAPAESYANDLPERIAELRFKREERHLLPLIEHFARQLAVLRGAPYRMIATVHRSRIDFSRGKDYLSGQRAYDDERAAPLYDAFETALTSITEKVVSNSEIGLLLDIHGCLTTDADLYIGTLNGRTSKHLNGKAFGKDDLVAFLMERGWCVEPKIGEPEKVFVGRRDSIIGRYNLAQYDGIFGSLQLEISSSIRLVPANSQRFAHDLAAAVDQLFVRYS